MMRLSSRLWLGLWLLAWCAVLYLSLRPAPTLPLDLSDKAYHLAGYTVMTALAAGFCHAPAGLLMVAVGTVGGSVLIEGLQHLLPYRSFELLDIAANATGAALGASLAILWMSYLTRRRPSAA